MPFLPLCAPLNDWISTVVALASAVPNAWSIIRCKDFVGVLA